MFLSVPLRSPRHQQSASLSRLLFAGSFPSLFLASQILKNLSLSASVFSELLRSPGTPQSVSLSRLLFAVFPAYALRVLLSPKGLRRTRLGYKVFVRSPLPAQFRKAQAYTSSADAPGLLLFFTSRGVVCPHPQLCSPPNPNQRCFLTSAPFYWGAAAAPCLAPPAFRFGTQPLRFAPWSVRRLPVRSASVCSHRPCSWRRRGRVHSLRSVASSAWLRCHFHYVRLNAPYGRNKPPLRSGD